MLYGHRCLPDVVVKHLLQIDIIMVIQSKRIPDNVCNLHPGVDENDFHNLEQSGKHSPKEHENT